VETLEKEKENQIAVINNSIEVFKTAPEILKANQDRSGKAVSVGKAILNQWEQAWSITDEDQRLAALAAADERSNKYLVNCGTAVKEEKETRAAITQLMDHFKGLFTAAENDIDRTKPNTVPSKVQNWRDTYAAEKKKIDDRRRAEAERAEAKAKALVELKASVTIKLSEYFNDYLLEKKSKLQQKCNAFVLDTFADDAAALRQYEPEYLQKHFDAFTYPLTVHPDISKEDVAAVITEVKMGKFEVFSGTYKAEMLVLKQDLVDRLPSKREELLEEKRLADEAEENRQAELKRQAEAEEKRQKELAASKNEEERKRKEIEAQEARKKEQEKIAAMEREAEEKRIAAEKEKTDREAAEQRKLQEEAEESKRIAEQNAEVTKQGDLTMAMFEKEAAIHTDYKAPSIKQGYEITILHPAAFVQIFTLWFEAVGKDLPVDKIGNTKLDQMKAWAEKEATKNDLKIESKFLKYTESIKAVNKKEKV
jgi:hypothetical protein